MSIVSVEKMQRAKLDELRPTQMTVGMREVLRKCHEWGDTKEEFGDRFIERHVIPAVLGPKKHIYIIDHHNLARALLEAKAEEVLVVVMAKLDSLDKDQFWRFLDFRSWVHPYDARGERRDFKDIPKTIENLQDDPYRSLAGELRRVGGYAKDEQPYVEFLWADALRARIDRKLIAKDYDKALEAALKFSKSAEADYLPGWCGPNT